VEISIARKCGASLGNSLLSWFPDRAINTSDDGCGAVIILHYIVSMPAKSKELFSLSLSFSSPNIRCRTAPKAARYAIIVEIATAIFSFPFLETTMISREMQGKFWRASDSLRIIRRATRVIRRFRCPSEAASFFGVNRGMVINRLRSRGCARAGHGSPRRVSKVRRLAR